MRCKHCKKKISEGQQQRVGLSWVHKGCYQAFRSSYYKKQKSPQKDSKTTQFPANSAKKKAFNRAWFWFSLYIRFKDADKNGMVKCISCGDEYKWNGGFIHAGHYIPKSAGEFFRFLEINVHGQCETCNYTPTDANKRVFRINLIRKIGEYSVEKLEEWKAQKPTLQRTTEDYRAISDEYREKYNSLKKQREANIDN